MKLSEAESKAHNKPLNEVHFHEVGAIDSIVDIVATAVCIDNLGIKRFVFSKICEGTGYVKCQHGILPVPVPAVMNIFSNSDLIMKITDNNGEMITPTGAAIAASLSNEKSLPESFKIIKTGIGTGKKDFKNANILRVMILREQKTNKETGTGFLLPGKNGLCRDPRSIQHKLNTICTKVGLDDVHMHTLRHTFATRCLENGVRYDILSDLLGHSSVRITLDYYVHCSMQDKRESMEKFVMAA